ncbi:MAG: hypothetical protein IJQ63_07200, partial [Synergistaceae bacterium]|nr:hypothetical protein [Synergistaceae bacterium]
MCFKLQKFFSSSSQASQHSPATGWYLKILSSRFNLLTLLLLALILIHISPAHAASIFGTWKGSGGSGTGYANGQSIPITMSYVGVEILDPELYGNQNVTLRSLVVNSNTGDALHEFDWNAAPSDDYITTTNSGNTWTFSNSRTNEKLTMTLTSNTTAT